MDNNFHGLSNDDFFGQKTNWFREIINFFKEKIFLVTHMTLKYDSISFFTVCILSFVELMQLMTYPFHEIFNNAWFIQSYSGIYDYFSKFFQIFKFIPYLKDKSFSLYLAIFYIIIFILLIVSILFVYLSIALKKNKLMFLWPIHIFKLFATLFNSILLIPFLEMFFSILNCNKLQNSFPNIACYQAEYIAHTFFACVGTIFTLFFAYVFATYFFDIKTLTNNYKNRQNTSFDVSMLVVKILIVIFFEFFSNILDSQNVILSLILLISSTLLFFKIWIEKPYYFLSTQKVVLLTSSLFFWTNINLFFEKMFKVFQYDGFDGNLEIWLLGNVLVTIYDIFYKEDYSKLLMINTQKIMRAEEALRKIKFFLELMDKRNTKKSYRILLKGYVFHHEENCEFKDCSLKIYKKKMIENPNTIYEDENKLLLSHCNRLYEISLSKFPKNTQLRIFYAVFLLERMKNINLSKMQLSLALSVSSSPAEQFSIYRFNKIITEEFFNFDDENLNLDIASTIAFDQYMKKCKIKLILVKEEIEKIGFSYIDFWNSFVQDDINIGKIRSLGFKINELIKSVFITWNCMQALNPNDKESLRLYGQFLIDILNEKTNGQQYIDKSKEAINNYNNIKFFKNDIFSLASDGSPCILASPVENKGAIITQLTLSASRIFGYDKLELIGKSVNVLLPSLFKDHHTEVINQFMKEKGDSKLSESKRINGMAIAKTNFIFPVSMTLNYLPSLTGEAMLAAIVKKEKQISYTAHMITNKDLDIFFISSECLKLFNMKEKAIWSIKYSGIKKDERLNLRDYIKELNEEGKLITDYDQEKNYPITIKENDNVSKILMRKSTVHSNLPKESYTKDFKQNYITNMNLVTMNYKELMMGPKSLDTYLVKFEVSFKVNLLTLNDIKLQEKLVFHYDEENINICVRNKNKLKSEKPLKNVFGDNELFNLSKRDNKKSKNKKKDKEEKKNDSKKEGDLYDTLGITNYELNIILFKTEIIPQTKDLILKKIPIKESRGLGDIVEIIETDTLVTDDPTMNDYENENDENEEDEDKTKIELKKSEILSRQHSTTSKSVIRLQWASFLIVGVHVVLAIINFIIYKNFLNDSDDFINGINYLSTQLNYTISSVDTLSNILILNHPNYTSYSDKLSLVSYYNGILQDNAKMLYDINNEMNSLPLFSSHNVSLYINVNVNFSYIESANIYGIVNLDYFEGLLELMSTIFSITVNYNTQMSFNDRDIYYFIYNALNSYYMKSIDYINTFMNIFLNLEISKTGLIIILITIVVYFVLMIFLFSVLKFSLSMMNGILLEFLQISPNQAQIIVRKCENFVKNVRINNMDEDDEDKEEDLDLKDVKRNKSALKDKLSKSSTGYNYIIVIMVFVYILIELYFDIIYIVVNSHQGKLAQYFTIYNATQYNNINQKLCSSAVKVMAFNPNFYIMNNPSKISTNNVFQTLVYSKQILDQHFQSKQFFSSNFIDFYNTKLMVVPLNYSNISSLKVNNEEYSFNLIYTNYEILLNILYDIMVKPFNITNVINNEYLTQANFINEKVLTNFMYQLSTNLYNDIINQNNFIWNFNVIWFVIYTTIIILTYFLIWRPIEYRLAKDYTRTKLVVLLIPTKIIMKNNKIKDFLIKENLVSIKK